MKSIRLLVSRVGTGFAQSPGDVIELPDAEAFALVKNGAAELVETAALDVDKAEKRNRRKQ